MKPAGGIQGQGFGKHASASQRRSLNSPSEGSTEVLQPCGPMPSVLSVNPVGVDCALLFTIEGEREREGKKEREGEKKRESKKKKEKRPEASVFVHLTHCFSRVCIPLLHIVGLNPLAASALLNHVHF